MSNSFSPQQIAQFTDFLTSTLIPDLRESGKEYTADDFKKAVTIIEQLSEEIMLLQRTGYSSWKKR
jgi:hypothetical protein